MQAYFPLPPNIKIPELKKKINGSISFLNCPSNRLKSLFFYREYRQNVFLGIYAFKNNFWILIDKKKCEPFNFLEINRTHLEVKDHQMVIAVVKKVDQFPLRSVELPVPDSLKIDNSPIAQRVSLNFSFLNSTTSYQGEYPLIMSNSKKSSFFSFDTLKEISV